MIDLIILKNYYVFPSLRKFLIRIHFKKYDKYFEHISNKKSDLLWKMKEKITIIKSQINSLDWYKIQLYILIIFPWFSHV